MSSNKGWENSILPCNFQSQVFFEKEKKLNTRNFQKLVFFIKGAPMQIWKSTGTFVFT